MVIVGLVDDSLAVVGILEGGPEEPRNKIALFPAMLMLDCFSVGEGDESALFCLAADRGVVVAAEDDDICPIHIGSVKVHKAFSHCIWEEHILSALFDLHPDLVQTAIFYAELLEFFNELMPTEVGAGTVFYVSPN